MEKYFTWPFHPFKHQKSQFFCTMSFSSFSVFSRVSVCDDQRSSFFTTVRTKVNENDARQWWVTKDIKRVYSSTWWQCTVGRNVLQVGLNLDRIPMPCKQSGKSVRSAAVRHNFRLGAIGGPLHWWKFKKNCDAWKDLEKTQKMSSIWASYLKLFRNGGQLKSGYQKLKSQICFILHFYHLNKNKPNIVQLSLAAFSFIRFEK